MPLWRQRRQVLLLSGGARPVKAEIPTTRSTTGKINLDVMRLLSTAQSHSRPPPPPLFYASAGRFPIAGCGLARQGFLLPQPS